MKFILVSQSDNDEMSSATANIKNILEIYRLFTPGIYEIITKTIANRKGQWKDKAHEVLTHPDLLENNKYLSDECRKQLDAGYRNLGRRKL